MPQKRVLIVTYYWPPSGGIGVLRCLKFAKYLREFGWEPVIFTAENPHYPSLDPSNEKDVPAEIEVVKGKIWEPYSLYKRFTGQKKDANVNNIFYVKETEVSVLHKLSVWIRSNFFIPDARSKWIAPSVKLLLKYLKDHPVDAILTNGPPHTNTRIGTLLKQKTGIPFLSDYQDPWTQVDYFQSLRLTKWGLAKHQRLEQEAFKAADHITIVSPSWKKDLAEIGAKNISVIPWGYDPDDYQLDKIEIDQEFTLTHLGIMGYDRNPKIFFQVINELINENKTFESDFALNLFGQVDYSLVKEAKEIGIESVFNVKGAVPRKEALIRTSSSNVLLLLLNQQDNVKGRIPGKLFEYLASKRPIIVLGPPDSDVANIISETGRGITVDYSDFEGIKKALLYYYKKYQEKEISKPLLQDISKYSSRNLTQQVAGLLDQISKK